MPGQLVNASVKRSILDFINEGKGSKISLQNTTLRASKDGFLLPVINLFRSKYRDYLYSIALIATLTKEEIVKYKYKPKLMSLDLYGTVDLWPILLWMNNFSTVTKFNPTQLLIVPPSKKEDLLTIIEKERLTLERNKKTPYKAIDE